MYFYHNKPFMSITYLETALRPISPSSLRRTAFWRSFCNSSRALETLIGRSELLKVAEIQVFKARVTSMSEARFSGTARSSVMVYAEKESKKHENVKQVALLVLGNFRRPVKFCDEKYVTIYYAVYPKLLIMLKSCLIHFFATYRLF